MSVALHLSTVKGGNLKTMNQLVIYGGGAAVQQLPKALRAAVAAANSVGAALAIIKKSSWYLSQANNARKAIVNAFTRGIGGGATGGVQRNVIPKVTSTRAAFQRGTVTGSIVQAHREYVQDVSPTSAAFSLAKFQISPSDRVLFKSLAYISRCFDKYRFKKLRFVYTPSCATTTSGRVAGAFEYDLNDTAPLNKVDLYAMEASRRGPFFEPMSWDMTPTGWMDVSLTGAEPKLSCPGYFVFASMECDTTGVKGELYVEYEVELKISSKFVPVQQNFLITNAAGLLTSGHSSTGDAITYISGQTVFFNIEGTFVMCLSVVNAAAGNLSVSANAGVTFSASRSASSTTSAMLAATITATKGGSFIMGAPPTTASQITMTLVEA